MEVGGDTIKRQCEEFARMVSSIYTFKNEIEVALEVYSETLKIKKTSDEYVKILNGPYKSRRWKLEALYGLIYVDLLNLPIMLNYCKTIKDLYEGKLDAQTKRFFETYYQQAAGFVKEAKREVENYKYREYFEKFGLQEGQVLNAIQREVGERLENDTSRKPLKVKLPHRYK